MYVLILLFFFFNDTATTEIYTLSLHDALPTSTRTRTCEPSRTIRRSPSAVGAPHIPQRSRSEEHTSELQSRRELVCRHLLEKKKKNKRQLVPQKKKKYTKKKKSIKK